MEFTLTPARDNKLKLLLLILLLTSTTALYAQQSMETGNLIDKKQSKRVWKLATLEWPPHSCSTCPDQGVALKIIRDFFDRTGEQLEVTFLPWRRAKLEFKEQKYDLIYPLWTWEYDEFSLAKTPPFYNSPIVMIYDPRSNSPFCLVESYSYGPKIKELVASKVAIESTARSDEQCLKLLVNGRSSGTLIDVALLQEQMKKNDLLKKYQLKEYDPGPLFLGYQPKDQQLVLSLLQEKLPPVKQQYQKIFEDYLQAQKQ